MLYTARQKQSEHQSARGACPSGRSRWSLRTPAPQGSSLKTIGHPKVAQLAKKPHPATAFLRRPSSGKTALSDRTRRLVFTLLP